jgi:hypothetical protein
LGGNIKKTLTSTRIKTKAKEAEDVNNEKKVNIVREKHGLKTVKEDSKLFKKELTKKEFTPKKAEPKKDDKPKKEEIKKEETKKNISKKPEEKKVEEKKVIAKHASKTADKMKGIKLVKIVTNTPGKKDPEDHVKKLKMDLAEKATDKVLELESKSGDNVDSTASHQATEIKTEKLEDKLITEEKLLTEEEQEKPSEAKEKEQKPIAEAPEPKEVKSAEVVEDKKEPLKDDLESQLTKTENGVDDHTKSNPNQDVKAEVVENTA